MLDDMTDRSKLIKAALALAEERGWKSIGLPDIAGRAGLSMAALRREFSSKTAILDGFRRAVDFAVLEKSATTTTGDGPRDRLFDVVMTRFEAMLPYRTALRRISEDLQTRPAELASLIGPALNTQYWMLQAAGIKAEGPSGFARVSALMSIHTRVFRIWLEDDDPAMAKTMAALDRRLRHAEQFAVRTNSICDTGMRILSAFSPRRERRSEPPAGAGPSGEPPPPQGPPPGPGGAAPTNGQTL